MYNHAYWICAGILSARIISGTGEHVIMAIHYHPGDTVQIIWGSHKGRVATIERKFWNGWYEVELRHDERKIFYRTFLALARGDLDG